MKTTKELIIADITAKVEAKLASQKVELANINDLFSQSETVIKIFNDKTEKIKKSISLALDLYNDFSGNKSQIDSLTNDWVNIIKSVKELGVELDPKYLKTFKQLNTLNDIKIANLKQYLLEAYNHPIVVINK